MNKLNILHVVTLLSPTGEFGGPVRVAENQIRFLHELGHNIALCSATKGLPSEIHTVPGVRYLTKPAKTLGKKFGFAGTYSLPLYIGAWKLMRKADVIHVHLGRDLITSPIALIAVLLRKKVLIQTHGMIVPDERLISKVFDAVLTKWVFKGASQIAYLTEVEREALLTLGVPNSKLIALGNGVPVDRRRGSSRSEIPRDLNVLFLARLQERKKPVRFVEMASILETRPEAPYSFSLVGPDEGEAEKVLGEIARFSLQDSVVWEGALDPTLTADRMSRAAVYVLPSVNEPFGMTVIEAAAVGVPVVVTESCGLASDVRRFKAGVVAEDNAASLARAVESVLESEERYQEYSRGALELAGKYSMENVGRLLEAHYGRLINGVSDRDALKAHEE